ncbi:DUF1963 domain-containing protein [Pseudomonas sp. NFR16]|uniref:DUF1963 domain-containing protein n=1 Tax=Pseudomonas sp. NFR16 TaxID=1566248 RepID=UPI0008CEFD28|nr:DUF1963 domain-containing protein [Pseudomonas sp. NFR16]SEI47138.1 protein of unknown function [Pseudomonas sp. NFR16]
MLEVKEIITCVNSLNASGIVFGGNAAQVHQWPLNPDGEPLILIATVDCAALRREIALDSIPAGGVLSIFSTYSKEDYFLDNITYSGDLSELEALQAGYTSVVFDMGTSTTGSPVKSIPSDSKELRTREISEDEFPVFSMCSQNTPKGLLIPESLKNNYEFIMQIYSSDFAEPFQDVFYLTDAVGYLFLNRDGSGDGLFFVQTG